MSAVVAAILALFGVYVAERWAPRVLARWDRVLARRENATAATVGRIRAKTEMSRVSAEVARRDGRKSVGIPADLEALVMEESAQWARDEQRAQIRALYAETGDWQNVRRAMGIGVMP